ncbi:MAG: hypothetical protein LBD31_10945 [Treponema sp.]|jgi:hypothetical protein|nr:hypothetical protein [Treponema sp.]
MKRKLYIPVLFVLLAALVLGSCDNFFSTSWGNEREYDYSNVSLSVNNLSDWLAAARGNPKLATALLKKILADLDGGKLSGLEKAQFQAAGVKIAIEAAGLGEAIISTASNILDKIEAEDEEAIKDVLDKIEAELKKNTQAAHDLAGIVQGSITGGGEPTFPTDAGSYGDIVKPSEAGEAIMILTVAVLDNTAASSLDNLSDLDKNGFRIEGGKAKVADDATPEAVALAAYLNLIAADTTGKFDSNPITGAIKKAFSLAS